MAKKERNYNVTITEKYGSCENSLFQKMAEKGDITAERIGDCLGRVIEITGYALCSIKTDDKEFEIGYYATKEGLISSGSSIFYESVTDYIGEVSKFKIVEIKTKKGKTYKAVPILEDETEEF